MLVHTTRDLASRNTQTIELATSFFLHFSIYTTAPSRSGLTTTPSGVALVQSNSEEPCHPHLSYFLPAGKYLEASRISTTRRTDAQGGAITRRLETWGSRCEWEEVRIHVKLTWTIHQHRTGEQEDKGNPKNSLKPKPKLLLNAFQHQDHGSDFFFRRFSPFSSSSQNYPVAEAKP